MLRASRRLAIPAALLGAAALMLLADTLTLHTQLRPCGGVILTSPLRFWDRYRPCHRSNLLLHLDALRAACIFHARLHRHYPPDLQTLAHERLLNPDFLTAAPWRYEYRRIAERPVLLARSPDGLEGRLWMNGRYVLLQNDDTIATGHTRDLSPQLPIQQTLPQTGQP